MKNSIGCLISIFVKNFWLYMLFFIPIVLSFFVLELLWFFESGATEFIPRILVLSEREYTRFLLDGLAHCVPLDSILEGVGGFFDAFSGGKEAVEIWNNLQDETNWIARQIGLSLELEASYTFGESSSPLLKGIAVLLLGGVLSHAFGAVSNALMGDGPITKLLANIPALSCTLFAFCLAELLLCVACRIMSMSDKLVYLIIILIALVLYTCLLCERDKNIWWRAVILLILKVLLDFVKTGLISLFAGVVPGFYSPFSIGGAIVSTLLIAIVFSLLEMLYMWLNKIITLPIYLLQQKKP